MSFTVEVPGGTNPLSLQGLCKALEAATTSLEYAQRQAAEEQLHTWETYPGYWSSLQVRTTLPPSHIAPGQNTEWGCAVATNTCSFIFVDSDHGFGFLRPSTLISLFPSSLAFRL